MISAPMSPSSRPVNGPASSMPELDDADAGERPRAVGLARPLRAARRRGRSSLGLRLELAPSCATSRSRASKTCSFMISSARSASRAASALVIWRW